MAGVNPTIKLKKKRTGKNSFKVRSEPVQSFFRLFSPTHQPSHVSLDMNEYTAMKQVCPPILLRVFEVARLWGEVPFAEMGSRGAQYPMDKNPFAQGFSSVSDGRTLVTTATSHICTPYSMVVECSSQQAQS